MIYWRICQDEKIVKKKKKNGEKREKRKQRNFWKIWEKEYSVSVFICARCNCSMTRRPCSHHIMIFFTSEITIKRWWRLLNSLIFLRNTHFSVILEKYLSAGPILCILIIWKIQQNQPLKFIISVMELPQLGGNSNQKKNVSPTKLVF